MTLRFAPPFFSLLAVAGLVACGQSSTVEDASIRFDASPQPDLGPPDLGPLPPGPGSPCTSDSECGDGFCIADEDFRDGYCSSTCATDEDCGEAGTCVQVDRTTSICFESCDPAAEDACRAGYGCASDFRAPNVCLPGCETNEDCPAELECDPTGGNVGQGSCFDPTASVGDACTDESECPAANFCLNEDFAGWPGGACIQNPCDYARNTGCPEGSVCWSSQFDGICFVECTEDSDCRDGYTCEASDEFPDRLACRPGCTSDSQCSGGRVCNPALGTCDAPFSADLGDTCNPHRGDCTGGTCLREFDTGLPGAFCTYVGCTPGPDATDGCPDDGVCVEGDGENLCFAGCSTDDDCRDGYACRAVDPDDASRGMGCFAACANDAVCVNDDFRCNVGTGLCTTPFESARLGQPCEDREACPGGLCLTEAAEGWPAGTCAAPGCPLTTDATGQRCPTGGVCVDDGDGDEIGYCLTSCTTGSTSCREGYACVALGSGSGTDGVCRPNCGADSDCGTGRTCDTGTGLCVTAG